MSRPTPTIAELLALPAGEAFKADARSTVWAVSSPAGGFVLKRYEHARPKQRLAWSLGVHPGQREQRAARRLAAAGFPVVPIHDAAMIDGRYVQASPRRGESLQAWFAGAASADDALRSRVVDGLAALAAELLAAGFVHRDLKLGNVLLADDGAPALIDVGAARRSRSRRRRRATLWIVFLTLRLAERGPRSEAALRERLLGHGVAAALLPDPAAVAAAVDSRDG